MRVWPSYHKHWATEPTCVSVNCKSGCPTTMLRRLLAVIGLGGRVRTSSATLDIEEAWTFSAIRDKHRFFKWVLSVVPEGTTWSIEGVNDPAIIEALREVSATDDVRM